MLKSHLQLELIPLIFTIFTGYKVTLGISQILFLFY